MTVSFQNPGVIDLDAAMTFGVSAKTTANPIGFFGTGLKYAIAVILRNGGKVIINAGGKSNTFTLAKRDSRGTEYQEVLMSGKQMRFSTNLGRNWEPWQAFRELYCNVKDEGGEATNRALKPRPGFTTITVSGWEAFDRAYEERSKFFLEERTPIFKGAHVEMYPGSTNGIYYRGILVGALPDHNSKYTYNITSYVMLTEDRTMKYPHQFQQAIGATMLTMNNVDLLKDMLMAERETAEGRLAFDHLGLDPSDTFLDTVQELRRGPESGKVNKNAMDLLDRARPLSDGTVAVELTEQQKRHLEQALSLLEKRFPDIRGVPLIPVATLGSGVYGLARKGKMYISLRCFEAGLVQLVGTIFEEYSHVTKDFRDESRDFQNYLINLVAQLIEELYDDGLRAETGLSACRRRIPFATQGRAALVRGKAAAGWEQLEGAARGRRLEISRRCGVYLRPFGASTGRPRGTRGFDGLRHTGDTASDLSPQRGAGKEAEIR